jgi:hypothetical protein
MWRHVDFVRIDVSKEYVAFIFRLQRIRTLGTLAVLSKDSFHPEDGRNKFLRKACSNKTHTVQNGKRRHS